MILPKDRPLLSEVERPTASSRIVIVERTENMLHHARLLVVRLFDEKAVVLDNVDGLCIRGPTGCCSYEQNTKQHQNLSSSLSGHQLHFNSTAKSPSEVFRARDLREPR